jgi:hypothetical protein
VADAAVSKPRQVPDRQPHAFPVVGDDGRGARLRLGAVDQHHRRAAGEAAGHHRVVAPGGRRQQQPVHPAGGHPVGQRRGAPRVVARIRDQQGVAPRGQHGFRARQDRREDRVGDARHQGADQARAPRAQRRGRGVRPEAEPGGLGQHAGGHGLGDQVPRVRVDGAGDGRDVDAGGLGDALEGRGSAPGPGERRRGAAAWRGVVHSANHCSPGPPTAHHPDLVIPFCLTQQGGNVHKRLQQTIA